MGLPSSTDGNLLFMVLLNSAKDNFFSNSVCLVNCFFCITLTCIHHVKKAVGPQNTQQLQSNYSLHKLLGQQFGKHLRRDKLKNASSFTLMRSF